ncbi:MAG TPA: periplasmic heavy metal sensor [Candidatus Binatia bacterium]|nr:periplasmic heavy metal sensor [Candidatus Binatia bacterium]
MTKCVIALTTLALIGVGSVPSQAQPMGGPPMGPMMRGDSPAFMLRMVLKQANLTAEQQEQVRKIIDADHQNLRALFTQLQAANRQMAEKLFAPSAVQAADLTPQVEKVAQLRRQLMEQGVKTALAIRAILTPQQLAKVAQVQTRLDQLQTEMRSLLEGNNQPQ